MIAETSRAGRIALTGLKRYSSLSKSFHSTRFCNDSKKQEKQSNTSSSQNSSETSTKKGSIAEADERIRQMLLDRDGGPASVPTREGKWDQDMGRETARQMFRVLDQTRQNNPGTDTAKGEGESKHWNRRNY